MSKTHTLLSHYLQPAIIAVVLGTVTLLLTALSGVFGLPYALGIIISTGIAGALYVFIDPRILLFGLLIVRMSIDATAQYFTISFSESLILTLSQLLGIAVFFLGIIIITRYYKHFLRAPLVFIFVALMLWAISSFFVSVSPAPLTTTVYEALRIFNIFALYILAYATIRTRDDFELLLRVLVIGSIIPLLAALFQSIAGIGYTDIAFDTPRVFATFTHPNIFSTYLIAMIAVALLLQILTKDIRTIYITRIFMVLYTIILIMTFSRVAWVALLIFIGIISLLRYRKVIPWLVALPIFLYMLSPSLQSRFDEALNPGVDSSITWRINLWEDTVKRTVSDGRSLYGNGVNTFSIVAESIRGNRFGSTDPHNEYVRAFVEGGWIGLGTFLLFIFWTIGVLLYRYIRATDATEKSLFLILFALAVSLAFASLSDHIFRSTPLQWIFFALIGSALQLQKSKKLFL